MDSLDYNHNEKRWRAYRKLEEKHKSRSLKNLSESGGIKIFKGLWGFSRVLRNKTIFEKIRLARIDALGHVHYMFGKVRE